MGSFPGAAMLVSHNRDDSGAAPSDPHVSIRIRIRWADQFAMGPGKADLLEAVADTRSIAGAGRALGHSYAKTRRLLHEMNTCFPVPLVATARGGRETLNRCMV